MSAASAQDLLGIAGSGQSVLPQAVKKADELGQEEFMELLVAQLNNQDPTKPMDNFEFLSQIAQFGTVSGIQDAQTSLEGVGQSLLATRALQASELAGRSIVSGSGVARFEAGGLIAGVVDLPVAASGVAIQISDMSGQLVKSIVAGDLGAGAHKFAWDGDLGNGQTLPAGRYQLSASALIDSAVEGVPAFAAARVASVSIEDGGATVRLNLDSGESVSSSEVIEYL